MDLEQTTRIKPQRAPDYVYESTGFWWKEMLLGYMYYSEQCIMSHINVNDDGLLCNLKVKAIFKDEVQRAYQDYLDMVLLGNNEA